jgi:hypothetical protein
VGQICVGANSGYHSVVHQFEGLQRFPIHGIVPETRCRSCGKSTRYPLSAKLIAAPFGCAQCGSRRSQGSTCICKRSPLLQHDRTAITRTFLGWQKAPKIGLCCSGTFIVQNLAAIYRCHINCATTEK